MSSRQKRQDPWALWGFSGYASEGVFATIVNRWCAVALATCVLASCSGEDPGDSAARPGGMAGMASSSGGTDGSQSGGSEGAGEVASGGSTPSGGAASGGATGAPEAACDATESTKNRELVAEALDELFVDKDVSAIDRYWAEPYHQHNPDAASGVEPFRNLMSSFVTSPSFEYERVRTLGECDLVVVQGIYSVTGVIFDMFRLRDGKIVEHWDSGVGEASETSGPTAIEDVSLTAAHRAAVLDFIDRVLIDGDPAAAVEFLHADYVEHRAVSASGPQGFLEYVEQDAVRYVKVHHVIADGGFVFTLSEGELDGQPYGFYDLFRLEGGAIMEHWDSRRIVPETTVSGLGIF